MKSNKIIGIVLLTSALGIIGYFGYQKYVVNNGMTTKTLVPPLSEEKEAFKISDPSVEETRKYPLEINVVKPNIEDVEEVRQISITFNKPMVPLGDFEKSAQGLPVTVEPKIDCNWRWLNRVSLGCQLDEALPASNEYRVKVAKGFKAFDGTELKETQEAFFTTSKWKVVQENKEWKEADLPILYWTFNQSMDKASIQKNLKSSCGQLKIGSAKKEIAEKYSVDITRTYSISFNRKIGLSKKCDLTLAKLAKAASGSEPGNEHKSTFKTYPEFKITNVQCQYNAKSSEPEGSAFKVKDCDPDSSVKIELSAPVRAKDLIGKIKVEPFFGWSKGGQGSPEYFKQNPNELYSQITLYSPLKGRTTHTIELTSITDQFNRPLKGAKTVKVMTKDFRPYLDFSSSYGVLEKKGPRATHFN